MQLSAQEIAQLLNGSVEGNPDATVSRPSKIEEGGIGTITFLANERYEAYAYTTTASVLLVNRSFQPRQPIAATLIRVDDVYAALSYLLEKFGGQARANAGISAQAAVHESAQIGEEVSIGAFTIVEEGARIGAGCQIAGQVLIGKNVVLGENVILHPGVRILQDCTIGDHCVLHPNVVIGSDGFGFAPQADGTYRKIRHTGNVIIEQHVEIGAGTTIDRATIGATIIRSGVKLDNLIQVAHNVEIGENTVIAAQTGIAGSTKIGKNCRIGGQVGFAGHINIADGTQIQAQSGIASHVTEPNTALFGSPAIPYNSYVRAYAVFKKLPELYKTIAKIERKINSE
ncbi:MAG TPA: UDP-3-O-(3-hydroxymyristoyl)glucosamine N-acyltransferase [Saprospiraceae bacterium]|mgnify:FL=1|nr:UDP-3-O-(3-hydroxymyristoyl)glucosamine N-acyltransferase [Saprospiraceae bacterium]HMP24696.1 UDP-3-O-(3-hydroxymyristoyl)glucosamine N-acyltransferase [Saprospiraceae bacterium]